MKISQFKRNLQIIITQLKELKSHRDRLINNANNLSCVPAEVTSCRQNIEKAFADTESQSLDKLVAHIKKRKSKRARRIQKLKTKKNQNLVSSNSLQQEFRNSFELPPKSLTNLKKREMRSANKYIETIDCLEELHQLRGGDDSCALNESLNPIKSMWQSTADSIWTEQQQSFTSIPSEWNTVLFGGEAGMDTQCNHTDFIDRRYTWDSYLDESSGTHIPIGWVYPNQDAGAEWMQYLSSICYSDL